MKTHLLTKKRALISSVAMLLVAMIALGTATFAWFTSRPDANATGLTIKATAANGLVILTKSHENYIKAHENRTAGSSDWTHDDFFKYTKNNEGTACSSQTPERLDATSFNLGASNNIFTKGFRTMAKDDTSYLADKDADVEDNKIDGFYQETVKCKVVGAIDDTKDYKVQIRELSATKILNTGDQAAEFKDLQNSLRVAVEYKRAGETNYSLVGVYSLNDAGSKNKYIAEAGKYSADGVVSSTKYTFNSMTSAKDTIVDTVGATGTDEFRVTVYLDGEDAGCKTSNFVASDLISDVKLDLLLVTTDK